MKEEIERLRQENAELRLEASDLTERMRKASAFLEEFRDTEVNRKVGRKYHTSVKRTICLQFLRELENRLFGVEHEEPAEEFHRPGRMMTESEANKTGFGKLYDVARDFGCYVEDSPYDGETQESPFPSSRLAKLHHVWISGAAEGFRTRRARKAAEETQEQLRLQRERQEQLDKREAVRLGLGFLMTCRKGQGMTAGDIMHLVEQAETLYDQMRWEAPMVEDDDSHDLEA